MESKKKTVDTSNLVRINRAKEVCELVRKLGFTILIVCIILGVVSIVQQPAVFIFGIMIIFSGIGSYVLLLALETIIKLLIMIYLKDS